MSQTCLGEHYSRLATGETNNMSECYPDKKMHKNVNMIIKDDIAF